MELPCGHAFETVCIEKWLGDSETCPLCRSVVLNGPLNPPSDDGSDESDAESDEDDDEESEEEEDEDEESEQGEEDSEEDDEDTHDDDEDSQYGEEYNEEDDEDMHDDDMHDDEDRSEHGEDDKDGFTWFSIAEPSLHAIEQMRMDARQLDSCHPRYAGASSTGPEDGLVDKLKVAATHHGSMSALHVMRHSFAAFVRSRGVIMSAHQNDHGIENSGSAGSTEAETAKWESLAKMMGSEFEVEEGEERSSL